MAQGYFGAVSTAPQPLPALPKRSSYLGSEGVVTDGDNPRGSEERKIGGAQSQCQSRDEEVGGEENQGDQSNEESQASRGKRQSAQGRRSGQVLSQVERDQHCEGERVEADVVEPKGEGRQGASLEEVATGGL